MFTVVVVWVDEVEEIFCILECGDVFLVDVVGLGLDAWKYVEFSLFCCVADMVVVVVCVVGVLDVLWAAAVVGDEFGLCGFVKIIKQI